MVHPLLLQREVLKELPGLLDDRGAREEPAVWPGYRSEAFAEDLVLPEPPMVVRRKLRVLPVLLAGAPLLAAVLGGAAALFGHSL